MYEPRFYRNWSKSDDLISFETKVRETDLFICATKNLKKEALESILRHRASVEKYIEKNPIFLTTLNPLEVENGAPEIVREMAKASAKVGVGPMASVAGAITEFVGKDLFKYSPEIIVENGGDIFIKTSKKRFIGIYAGKSIFSGKIALEISGDEGPLGICTSSGTVGHSLSFGNADAATIIAETATLADACATAVGNIVKKEDDIIKGIEFARRVPGVKGAVIVIGEKMSSWGKVKFV